ncbi:MAG: hypothetical protein ACJ74W_01690 [Pyrinomonadaceae bacterium]
MSKDPSSISPPKIFFNPWVGFVGTIASVLGVAIAIYFYAEGRKNHQLAYYVNPAKTVVVQAGQASKLVVNFDNQVIGTDITAAQVAFWNQGKLSIRRDDVLKPIVIYTENNAPILEATLRKSSRDVVQISLSTDDLQKGRVPISWNILEHNDGGIIQLIYAGNPNVHINMDGVIEGQKNIFQVLPSSHTTDWSIDAPMIGILAIQWIIFLIIWVRRHFRGIFTLVFLIIIPLLVLFYLGVFTSNAPPFGF